MDRRSAAVIHQTRRKRNCNSCDTGRRTRTVLVVQRRPRSRAASVESDSLASSSMEALKNSSTNNATRKKKQQHRRCLFCLQFAHPVGGMPSEDSEGGPLSRAAAALPPFQRQFSIVCRPPTHIVPTAGSYCWRKRPTSDTSETRTRVTLQYAVNDAAHAPLRSVPD